MLAEVDPPVPRPAELLLRVRACGVCRTDLTSSTVSYIHPKLPLIPGHQIVGLTADGRRLGVPWLGWTCGACRYCRSGRENLCERARFTGYDIDGGYAEWAVADERFCFPLPDGYADLEVAPLLCAGLIGYRALRMAGDAERLGLYGFGAAAHIVAQVARFQGRRVFAITRAGDEAAQAFARSLGAEWAGAGTPPGGARRGDHLRAGRRARARGPPCGRQGRHRRLRRDPHVGHPVLSLRDPLGRAHAPLGREPHPPRRRGVPRARATDSGAHRGRDVPARAGKRGPLGSCARAMSKRSLVLVP